MPDKRKHRGKHPDDDRLFAESQREGLRAAVADYSWLLTRGYAQESALKVVGDRHGLTARQRLGVMRSACSDESLRRRMSNRLGARACGGGPIGIDGYNLLITIEGALSGGVILIGRDGCYRDLAGIHGTYRKVQETRPALELIIEHLTALDVARIDWYLDRPVSNSGRLKTFMAEVLEAMREGVPDRESPLGPPESAEKGLSAQQDRPPTATWNIELVDSPDARLCDYVGPAATSDSVVLDRCHRWVNLAREIITAHVRQAWVIDLRSPDGIPIPAE